MIKKFVASARVSSREQAREGFSLDVQVEAFERYAQQHNGEIVKLFRVSETASKTLERKTFREMIAYVKKHASELDGLLFYKVDRAARNLIDYVELERLESDYGVPFIPISQPTEKTPAGRMMRRTLANMASFYTEQQALDIREGINRRVKEGLFVSKARYGYKNVRVNDRSIVEIDTLAADNIRRIFHLYAYESLTLNALIERLENEGRAYRPSQPKFPRSSLFTILNDRSYIGELKYLEEWYPGKHEALVDRGTWERVQALLGGHVYQAHEMAYAGEFMKCGFCGRPVTGERKIKKTSTGDRAYVYYRCARYNVEGHPRIRVGEAELDKQMLAIFDKMRIEDESVREWFVTVLRSKTQDTMKESRAQRLELERQAAMVTSQQDRLINMRMNDEINESTFASKQTELRDRLAKLKLQLDVVDRGHDENSELAVKVFELSQTLRQQWVKADYAAKRKILDIVCLNSVLDGATLCPTMRKPFDVMVKGLLVSQSGGGGN